MKKVEAPGGPLSRREAEEIKKRQDEEAAAHVFKEFVETFQEAPSKISKVWVKAGTFDAGSRREDTTECGKIYKPQSRWSDGVEKQSTGKVSDYVKSLASKPDKPAKKKDKEKKKSNLEMFKEELKQIQEEREERHKYKSTLKGTLDDSPEQNVLLKDDFGLNSTNNSRSTNIYLGNLNPKIKEQELKELFGKFGPLASIKIMWPRSMEDRLQGFNRGFVAFMTRKDADKAIKALNGKEVMQYEMKMSWSRAIALPPFPIYIHPSAPETALQDIPLNLGLPFNAQPPRHLINKIPSLKPGEPFPSDPADRDQFNKILSQSIVKVIIPRERTLLMLIHRMIEYVIREGPLFEAMVMNKQEENPYYRFLFDNKSPAHVYYRWKLFSLLQGDTPKRWKLKDFRMYKGGPIWRPPPMNLYTLGLCDLLSEDELKDTKGVLSKTQRERLEELIRQLAPDRIKIGEAMVFCIEHGDSASEICECLAESLSSKTTTIHKKIARIYLISDILHNCGVKVTNASFFRKEFQKRLIIIMYDIYDAWQRIEDAELAEGFRVRISNVLRTWEDSAIYSKNFLQILYNILYGIEPEDAKSDMENANRDNENNEVDSADGEGDDDEEGGPLDGAALLKAAQGLQMRSRNITSATKHPALKNTHDDDIDGVPMIDDDIDGVPLEDSSPLSSLNSQNIANVPGFVPSKWESVEPSQVEAGAITSQRWNEIQGDESPTPEAPPAPIIGGSPDNDSNEVTDERRLLLRSVEVRAMQYQDELENGQRPLKSDWTIQQQVQHYRRKLIKKAEREAKEKEDGNNESPDRKNNKDRDRRSSSSDEDYNNSTSSSRKSKRSRDASPSPTPKKSRHRSRSPLRSSKSSKSNKRGYSSPSPPSPLHHSSSKYSDSRKHKHKHKY